MAPTRLRGASTASLYEFDVTLDRVFSDLSLAPLSAEDERKLRDKLGRIIGRGLAHLELSKKHNPEGALQSKDIVQALKAIARNFQAAEQKLRGLETGFRHSHEIEVARRARETLAQNPELKISASDFLNDFCNRLNTVSHACLVAAADLKRVKGKAGQKPIDWYDDFTRVLICISGRNNIRTTIGTDRTTGKPRGRFLELGAAFERLLYPTMRSPSVGALAKRLSQSCRRIREGKNRASAE
jgi:hypothetical protein